MSSLAILDGKRVFRATNVRIKNIHPIYLQIAESLSHIDDLKFIKVYNDRLCASSELSTDKKKAPVTTMDQDGIIGIELFIDPSTFTIQFYSLASSKQGCGRKMVNAVVNATPDNWTLVVVMDWSGGFWDRMLEEHPRIVVF